MSSNQLEENYDELDDGSDRCKNYFKIMILHHF
jgi:hypothetical protein